jgi:hypothetical protein
MELNKAKVTLSLRSQCSSKPYITTTKHELCHDQCWAFMFILTYQLGMNITILFDIDTKCNNSIGGCKQQTKECPNLLLK